MKKFDYLVASGMIFSLLFSSVSHTGVFALKPASSNEKGGSFVYIGKSSEENKKEKDSENSGSSSSAPVIIAGTIAVALLAAGIYKIKSQEHVTASEDIPYVPDVHVPDLPDVMYGGPPPFDW